MDIYGIRLENLHSLIRQAGSRKSVADLTGVSYNLLNQYLMQSNPKRIGDQLARRLENAFDLPPFAMDHTGGADPKPPALAAVDTFVQMPSDTQLTSIPMATIPVISWVQAGQFTPVKSASMQDVIEWLPYHVKAGKNGFGLIVQGESMLPEFRPDDRIYVNPDYQPDELKTGDLVIVACESDNEATFKKLIIEGGRYYLKALNPNWDSAYMVLDSTCRFVGKVVGLHRDF